MIVILGSLFFLLLILAGLSIVFWSLKNGISPMPTSRKAKKLILDSIPEKGSNPIYELGSGWGTLAFALAKKFPQHQINAYETSTIPFLFCKFRQMLTPCSNLHLYRQDFFYVSLMPASVVVCYLYPGAMAKLKSKFEDELLAGSIIVSNTFQIPEWKATKIMEVNDLYKTKIYVYKVMK